MKVKYVIYKMVEPSVLEYVISEGYYTSTVHRTVLEPLRNMPYEYNDEHDSLESAIAEIEKYKKKLRGVKISIQTVIDISYWDD